jgi:hypothetical protein
MNFLADFFCLRWRLSRWAIPTVWTLYVLHQLYAVLSIVYSTLSGLVFPAMAHRWQNIGQSLPLILTNIISYAGSQLLLTAIFGILLFAAQRNLFGKVV